MSSTQSGDCTLKKSDSKTYMCATITIFAIILLVIILRLDFPGKFIFCAIYVVVILGYTVIIYNHCMPRALQFTHTTCGPLLTIDAFDDHVGRVESRDSLTTQPTSRLLLHDF